VSRSNPQHNAPNPAIRWFEWNGETGIVRYYDKAEKKNIDAPLPFKFLLLDELATVRGWHKSTDSAIFANEVRDTRRDVLVVKAFKGGVLAEGRYKEIKDRVNVVGGQFVANCYVGFKHNGELEIASLQFKGSALGAWMEFRKANRRDLLERAIEITGFTEGQTGRVVFRVPTFALCNISTRTQNQAVALDKQLQAWIDEYLKRRVSDAAGYAGTADADVNEPSRDGSDDAIDDDAPDFDDTPGADNAPGEDDIPF
jgi:hypothetical protein